MLIVATVLVVGVSVLQLLRFRKTKAKMEVIKRRVAEVESESRKLKIECS